MFCRINLCSHVVFTKYLPFHYGKTTRERTYKTDIVINGNFKRIGLQLFSLLSFNFQTIKIITFIQVSLVSLSFLFFLPRPPPQSILNIYTFKQRDKVILIIQNSKNLQKQSENNLKFERLIQKDFTCLYLLLFFLRQSSRDRCIVS